MKGYVFNDPSHANRYLAGCIILIRNLPCYVHGIIVDDGPRIEYNILGEKWTKRNVIGLYHQDVSLEPVKLGWVNWDTETLCFVSRFPNRASHIGLHANNLHSVTLSLINDTINRSAIILSNQLAATIKNDYPSFEKALSIHREHNGRGYCVAFSRQFALFDGKLVRGVTGMTVGGVKGETVILNSKYEYLYDKLLENGIPCVLSKNGD